MRRLNDRLTALLVSADSRFAGLYQNKLELDGYRVEVMNPSAERPLRSTRAFDLIFVDVDPDPGAAGVLIQRLRRRKALRGVPVLALSRAAEVSEEIVGALGHGDRMLKVPSFIR